MNDDDTVTERVARGAAWLDVKSPGWERRVDLASLALRDSCRCVLGQLFGGSFWLAPWPQDSSHEVMTHGFNTDHDTPKDYAALDEAWIALIKDRFDTGALSDEVAP